MTFKHYEKIQDIVPLELYEKIRTAVPLDKLSELLHKDVRNTSEWHLHTGKYIQKLDLYLTEKMRVFCALGLHEEQGLRIFDIGSGVGLFPWICKLHNHKCESSYYDYFEFYKDSWEILEIEKPFFFEIKRDEPWNLPLSNRYDVICSMRTVFDRQPSFWKVGHWINFFKEANNYLNPNGKLLIKTNRVENKPGEFGDLDVATLRLLEPFLLEGFNSRTFMLTKDEIQGLIA